MTLTTTETFTVDGVDLTTLAKNIQSLSGRLRTPPVRTNNIRLPGRHGTRPPSFRVYDENVITLPMWVRGTNDNGVVTTTARREFYNNVDQLTQLFSYHKSLLKFQHTLPDGSVRENWCHVQDVIDIQTDAYGDPVGLFTVSLVFHDPFWQASSDVSSTFTGSSNLNSLVTLTNFAGATAPMTDLLIRWTGPVTNPKIIATYDGTVHGTIYASYADTISAGNYLEFDCETWSFNTSGVTFSYGKWSHSGGARFFTVFPNKLAAAPVVRFEGTGGGAGTGLSFTGRKKFLVG